MALYHCDSLLSSITTVLPIISLRYGNKLENAKIIEISKPCCTLQSDQYNYFYESTEITHTYA